MDGLVGPYGVGKRPDSPSKARLETFFEGREFVEHISQNNGAFACWIGSAQPLACRIGAANVLELLGHPKPALYNFKAPGAVQFMYARRVLHG